MDEPTLPPSGLEAADRDDARVPGLVMLFTGGAACARALRLPQPSGGALELGRGEGLPNKLDDGRVSRRHALVEGTADGRFTVTDLASQNGTFVDGKRAPANLPVPLARVLRLGDSLLMPCADVRPFEQRGVARIDGFVRGPAMQALLDEAARAGRGGVLHICGESGSGKEGVAEAFHQAGPRAQRSLVAVNCATIPHELAERLLFGAKRGAYSGAVADATGVIQEADGSTLFLDEIAELEPAVQAKLLRVLETKELLPLGAVKPRPVDFALCSATNKDLRGLVAAGLLREDLYFRVGRPAVVLPPLRERMEEIPALIEHGVAKLAAGSAMGQAPDLKVHVSLVEQCLLRPWPGNVRELLAELAFAARSALAEGSRVESRHLSPTAGSAFGIAMPEAPPAPPAALASSAPAARAAPSASAPPVPRPRVSRSDAEWRPRIEETLRRHGGNIAAAARALGLHRTQLRRLIEQHGVSVESTQDAAYGSMTDEKPAPREGDAGD